MTLQQRTSAGGAANTTTAARDSLTSDVSELEAIGHPLPHSAQSSPHESREKPEVMHSTIASDDPKAEAERLLAENSPYEEVRVAVRNTDGGEVTNTVRAWIMGMVFVTVGAGLNMFLSMRFVSALPPAAIAPVA